MPKFLQCHCQPRAPQKRSVSSVNNNPTTVDIFQKFYENDPSLFYDLYPDYFFSRDFF